MHSHLSVHRAQIAAAQPSWRPGCCWGPWRGDLSRPCGDAVAVPVAVAGAGGEPGRGSGLHAVLLWGLAPHPRHLMDLHGGLRRVVDMHLHQGGVHGGWAQGLGQSRATGPYLLKRAQHSWFSMSPPGCPSISPLYSIPEPLPREDRMEHRLPPTAPSKEGSSCSTSKLVIDSTSCQDPVPSLNSGPTDTAGPPIHPMAHPGPCVQDPLPCSLLSQRLATH